MISSRPDNFSKIYTISITWDMEGSTGKSISGSQTGRKAAMRAFGCHSLADTPMVSQLF
jgi:hypothetical protein